MTNTLVLTAPPADITSESEPEGAPTDTELEAAGQLSLIAA